MRRLKARERIEHEDLTELHYKAVYQLYLEAYDDPVLAQQAQTKALELQVRRSCALGYKTVTE